MFYPLNEQQQGHIQIPLPLHLDTSNSRTNHVPLNSTSVAVSAADSRSMILSLENNVNVVSNIIRDSENLVKIKCGQCRKRFDTNEEMVAHQAKHLTESKYKCELCGKHFPSQSSVWKHTKAHSGERPFVCSICNKAFTQLANLQRHNLVHNGLKPYKCPTCQKAFSQHANMVKHQMLHTGEKPFKCKSCDKAFAQRANLKKHEMIHLGIRPYGCNICLKSYSQQSNLKKHILTHQKKNGKNGKNTLPVLPPTSTANYIIYQCNICKQELADISDFNKHIKICNLNPMNNPHLGHHQSNGGVHHSLHNVLSAVAASVEPKKESIEIKTETIDEGSNTNTPPVMSHLQQHSNMQHNSQVSNHQPQAIAAAHHQILTTNGHIITNFLDLNSHHLHHLDYGKH
ncbi:zinc finger protein OZF-like isoform X2 [Chironomus tepperi]|uniref:zinc finger protein OZF-like isoform X2 n=1 Tax=Chironomus tepperi TaxID=113505 RepID=UPI00391F2757